MDDREVCWRCGSGHNVMSCPQVKAVNLDPETGAVTRVEFMTPADAAAVPPKVAEPNDNYPRKGQV